MKQKRKQKKEENNKMMLNPRKNRRIPCCVKEKLRG
jgi:hypothetical protein